MLGTAKEKKQDVENATTDQDKTDAMIEYLEATDRASVKREEVAAAQEQVDLLTTQLRVAVEALRTSALTTGEAVAETVDQEMLNDLGLLDDKKDVKPTSQYPVIFTQGCGKGNSKVQRTLDSDLDDSLDEADLLKAGYGSPNGEVADTASALIRNKEILDTRFLEVLSRYDQLSALWTYVPKDPNAKPKQGFLNGKRVKLTAPSNVLSRESVIKSATFMLHYTEFGSENNSVLMKIAKKISEKSLYDRVMIEFNKLPADHRLGQVLLYMVIKESILMDSATLEALETWIERDDLDTLYGGDISKLAKVYLAVMTVLLEYNKMPFQPAKNLLEIFSKSTCVNIAAPCKAKLQAYLLEHAIEKEVIGGQTNTLAVDHFNQASEVLTFVEKIYNQELRAGRYQLDGSAPAASMNAFSDGASDDVEYKWYSPAEYRKLTSAQKKKLRELINQRGPAPGTPDEFKEKLRDTGDKGNYSRKQTWSAKSPGYNSKMAKKLRSAGGAMVFDGQLKMWCKHGCGVNLTHTSGGHSQWSKNPATYCLPAGHPGRALLANIGDTPKATNEPSYDDLLKKINDMQSGFKAVAALSTEVLEAEARVDPDPVAAAKRLELVTAWKNPTWIN